MLHKSREISWAAERQLASQEESYFMDLMKFLGKNMTSERFQTEIKVSEVSKTQKMHIEKNIYLLGVCARLCFPLHIILILKLSNFRHMWG
jgi:hypothetical protein